MARTYGPRQASAQRPAADHDPAVRRPAVIWKPTLGNQKVVRLPSLKLRISPRGEAPGVSRERFPALNPAAMARTTQKPPASVGGSVLVPAPISRPANRCRAGGSGQLTLAASACRARLGVGSGRDGSPGSRRELLRQSVENRNFKACRRGQRVARDGCRVWLEYRHGSPGRISISQESQDEIRVFVGLRFQFGSLKPSPAT